ncbi:MAG: 8-oxo-dGTP diphosphatase [Bacilli bacterium]|nr:8-oxo-dGTP diphosphatase [Bacilli bacterium]
MEETVLCYIENEHRYLMLFRNKKKNDLNSGKYIGIGGHIEPGESKEEALIREVKEETGLTLTSFQYRAKLLFINDDFEEIMHLFTANEFTGTLKECDEGELHWIDIDDVLKVPHWEGDEAFLKKMLTQKDYFEMTLIYKQDQLVKIIG